MNIQEGIKELESLKMKSEDIRADYYNDGLNAGIAVMKKLDEPQKPVVPQFVADWFEEHKDDLEFSIWDLCVDSFNSTKGGMYSWIQQLKNKPIETLVKMLDGYEVEKELSWIVKRLDGTIVTQFALWGQDGKYWGIDTSHPKPLIFTNKEKADAVALLLDGEVVEG